MAHRCRLRSIGSQDAARPVSALGEILRRAASSARGRTGVLTLVGLVLIAIAAPMLLPDPLAQPDILQGVNQPPGAKHWFGTDQLSRDVLSRVVTGARISLTIAFLAVAVSVTLGAMVGLVAGYWGGWVDAVLMRIVDGALAIPRLFVLLLVVAAWESLPLLVFILLLGTTGWFGTSRLIRGEVLRLKQEPYVRAAEALGAHRIRIVLRHLLPNTAGPLLVAATLGVGNVVLLEAGLSFLGVGVRPPTPTWGGMILDSQEILFVAPWTSIFPGLAIVITVLAVNLFGDALREAVDPRHA
ncbi:MAG: ABC transporter permease [Gemmatimonadales bacterium]|nr:ABC transporter permease [Gemmatimonadales bacterium]